jgi:hypothetical protein
VYDKKLQRLKIDVSKNIPNHYRFDRNMHDAEIDVDRGEEENKRLRQRRITRRKK